MLQGMLSRRLVIHGRVQGVGFRDALQDEARRLNLSGWVRNRRDGTVEALVHGPEAAVEALIRWSRQGPPLARVAGVSVEDVPRGTVAPDGFERLPSA
ncbi:MAG: acylphosphatase [Clostridia bacterium]